MLPATAPASRLLIVLGSCAIAVFTAFVPTAAAGAIRGSYSISWAGTTGLVPNEPAGSAAWSFKFAMPANTDGDFPATLVAAQQANVVTPCADNPDAGTITTYVNAVSDGSAQVRAVVFYNLRTHVGKMTLVPALTQAGFATLATDRECTDDPSKGVTTMPIDASSMLHQIITPRGWTIRQSANGTWSGRATQRVSLLSGPNYAPQIHTMNVQLSGTPASLHAFCHLPAPPELRSLRTVRAAKAYMTSLGFPKPMFRSSPSYQVGKGHFSVLEQDTQSWLPCGPRSITLQISSGRPNAGGGHGEM